jgi:antitoxin HicB
MVNEKHISSSFDDFLVEEEIYTEVTIAALKRVIAWQVQEEMAKQQLNKADMAQQMQISPVDLDRLLDPESTSINLQTIDRAAKVLGKRVDLRLVDIS